MYILHFPMKSLYIYENENLKAAINFYFIIICISIYLTSMYVCHMWDHCEPAFGCWGSKWVFWKITVL